MIPRRAFRWALLVALLGCGERERLTFPDENPGNGSGPITEITRPGSDTVMTEGDLLFVQGRTYDVDGVDTVYFETGGANQGFAPIEAEGDDTVSFLLQISTLNLGGRTVIVRVHGVDLLGEQGDFSIRQIRIE